MNNKVLQELYASGADAMSNMFDVSIVFPRVFSGKDKRSALKRYRLTGDVALPKTSINTYEVAFGPYSIKKPATGVLLDRKLSLTFRVDAHFLVYQGFKAWSMLQVNPSSGFVSQHFRPSNRKSLGAVIGTTPSQEFEDPKVSPDDPGDYEDAFGSIILRAGNTRPLRSDSKSMYPDMSDLYGPVDEIWVFDHIWIESIDEPKFTVGNNPSAQTITVHFHFGNMKRYPEHALLTRSILEEY